MGAHRLQILSRDSQDTMRMGRKLSELLQSGDLVTLQGDLGSGKTVLTQGICDGLGVTQPVTSPTYTIVHEYKGRLPVYHFDFYRIQGAAEVDALDMDYYFGRPGVSIIEWAERAGSFFQEERFHVAFSWVQSGDVVVEDQRMLHITAPAHRHIQRLGL